MEEVINQYLANVDLDIRKMPDARFLDQKCTPDVLCFIADCVINYAADGRWFTVKDIWDTQYFITNTKAVFNKPLPTNLSAQKEYDKFIQQPLRLLGYAQLLDVEKRGGTNFFRIKNEDILDYISRKERNTFVFLVCYIEKLLHDSGLNRYFDDYKEKQRRGIVSQDDYTYLKDRFERYIRGNTNIQNEYEPRRIFPKILNILAVQYELHGSDSGRMSKYPFTFSELMYNRKNWRDLNKEKGMTRQEAAAEHEDREQQEAYNNYYVQKAIAIIRKIHPESEVKDEWGNGDATQVHHIFPKAEFPQIAHYVENLIRLTPTQHNTKAHPHNKTNTICKDYQLTCLLFKADSIEQSLRKVGEKYYRKESFIYVINTGLASTLEISLSFRDIKTQLIQIYNAA